MGRTGHGSATAAVLALALALPAAAVAGVRSAESVLPPGQSGFVPPEGQPDNPHLTDQVALFESLRASSPRASTSPARSSRRAPGVTITRDAYGVPSVRAGSTRDAWFGVGYAVAQDRLVELELFRRSTQGRLAEVLGESRLASTTSWRAATTTRAAELRAPAPARCRPRLRARFDAYAEGVNAWIARVAADPSLRPRELALLNLTPAPWTALDSAAIGVQLARTVPSDDGRELENWRALRALGAKRFARLLPLRQRGAPTTVPASAGRFPSQPGRSRARRAARLQGVAALPEEAARRRRPPRAAAHVAGRLPARGGSFHCAFRGARQHGARCSPRRSSASRSPSCSSSSRSTRPASTCAASPAPASR